jgi:hypothetical protein
LPVGLIAATAVGCLWLLLTPLHDPPIYPGLVFTMMVILIPVHELVHLVFHPHSGSSSQSVLGFWPSKCLFYANYLGEMSRSRLITILLAPLLVISFGPLIVCAGMGASSIPLAIASTLNAFFGCVDITGTGLLLFQVPTKAIVRNQGYNTYWKEN